MASIWKELYHGRIYPSEKSGRDIIKREEYRQVDKKAAALFEELWAVLPEPQKEMLQSYYDVQTAVAIIEGEEAFLCGFQTGCLLLLDVFYA